MEPKLVDEAQKRPGRCLASRDVKGPFIDVGVWAREHDPYLYLSVPWFEETARNLLGMVSKTEVEERFAGLEAQLHEQAKRIEELKRFEEAAVEFEDARRDIVARQEREGLPEPERIQRNKGTVCVPGDSSAIEVPAP